MNLKKKIAVSIVAVCSSIAVPVVANAGEARIVDSKEGIHSWEIKKDTQTQIYTMHHGYSVGDDEYKDCVITTTTLTTTEGCPYCNSEEVTKEMTDSHSACGL